MGLSRKFSVYIGCAAGLLYTLFHLEILESPATLIRKPTPQIYDFPHQVDLDSYDWGTYKEHYPASKFSPIPRPNERQLPDVQRGFHNYETRAHADERQKRLEAVKDAFRRCWSGYVRYAWLHDELSPLSVATRDADGQRASTLVESLDTLWIMDMKSEFRKAVDAAVKLDFSFSSRAKVNVFDTTVRYLGGFLSAYDLSGDKRLLEKSLSLANMLYAAFDTPNRMPIIQWDAREAADPGERQVAPENVLLGEIGALSLEYTRLAQITQDPKWYDAVARIMVLFEKQQNLTNIPGLWPTNVNLRDRDFTTGNDFSLGAMSDSIYEYLPKMYALLGGSEQYANMYRTVVAAARQHAIFKPMNPGNTEILMTGVVLVNPENSAERYTYPQGQHLACYAGGMIALGGRLLGSGEEVQIGRMLTDGCIWAYESSPLGIMPEVFTTLPCWDPRSCDWDEAKYHEEVRSKNPTGDNGGAPPDAGQIIERERLPKGITAMMDRRYLLRPEAIESIFVLWRITGDLELQEAAWRMFTNIQNHTKTDVANAALADVTDPADPKFDVMESTWMAETLKYFYLTFSDPDLISLDDFVMNTKAHPFKRPTTSHWGSLWRERSLQEAVAQA